MVDPLSIWSIPVLLYHSEVVNNCFVAVLEIVESRKLQLDWLSSPTKTKAELSTLIKNKAVEDVSLEFGQVDIELLLEQPNYLEPVFDVNLRLDVRLDHDSEVCISCDIRCVLEPLPPKHEGRGSSLEAPLILIVLEKAESLASTRTHNR